VGDIRNDYFLFKKNITRALVIQIPTKNYKIFNSKSVPIKPLLSAFFTNEVSSSPVIQEKIPALDWFHTGPG